MKRLPGVCLLLCALPVVAMHITRTVGVAGFSEDGASVLLQVSEDGPEGGGQLSYRLVSSVEKEAPTFLISSDFSPGGADHPQRISVEACQSTANTLQALLARLNFTGLRVDRTSCGADRRASVVTRTTAPVGQRFQGDGAQLTLGALRLSVVDTKLTLADASRTVRLMDGSIQQGLRMEAVMSPSHKLLLVFARSPYNEAELLGAFVSPSGKVADFKPLRLP